MKPLPSSWRSLRAHCSNRRFQNYSVSHQPSQDSDKARAEFAEDLAWARSAGSRTLLAQPRFLEEDFGGNATALESLDAYLKARRWTAPPGPAKRFLSHLLTYPLTLAAGLTEAGVAPWADTSAAAEVGRRVNAEPSLRPTLSVVCIGARAEGSLPPSLWLEAIFALPGVSHLDLSLVGPEVTIPRNLPVDGTSREASMPQPTVLEESRHEGKSPSLKLCLGYRTAEITWIRAVVGEQAGQMTARSTDLSKEETLKKSERAWGKTEEVERILRKADAYVLFNPGLGHPHLVQSWEVATEMLLKSGKPVVITGHSEQDLNRDARQLSLIGGQCCVRWDKGRGNELRTLRNAFGSMRRTQDPLAVKGADLVSPNWGMLVLRATQGNVNEW